MTTKWSTLSLKETRNFQSSEGEVEAEEMFLDEGNDSHSENKNISKRQYFTSFHYHHSDEQIRVSTYT